MPWRGQAGPTEAQKCISCFTRYWQSAKTHLCRQCEKEAGIIYSLNARRREELIAQQDAAARMAELAAPPKPTRTIEVNGRLFDVVWDGTR